MDTPPILCEYGRDQGRPWQVCVVPNLYPVLDAGSDQSPPEAQSAIFKANRAVGLHEVVIESPSHITATGQLTTEQVVLMLRAYRDRMLAMRDTGNIAYVQVIKNAGMNAGASLSHTHSQIFGMPFVPQQIQQEMDGAAAYFSAKNRCPFCDVVNEELEKNQRVVAATPDFVAWCPYASRFGYETWIAPRRHSARFEDTDDMALEKLGVLFQLVLRKVERNPRIDAFNYLIHSLPFDSHQDDHYHWHIEIIPRTFKVAGFEWGTGVHVNTVAPEQAAKELRVRL